MQLKIWIFFLLIVHANWIEAQSKVHRLDSINYVNNTSWTMQQEKTSFTYRGNDSLESITNYNFDTLKKNFVPRYQSRFYDVSPTLYYYSNYTWDTLREGFFLKDSYKMSRAIYANISYDSSFVWKASRWQIHTVKTFWHSVDHYSNLKLYDSTQWFDVQSNSLLEKHNWKYDAHGLDTFMFHFDVKNNRTYYYRKVYDTLNRLKEKYYALQKDKYYLKEVLRYDVNSNLIQIDFVHNINTIFSRSGSYVPFNYRADIKLKDCNFRYNNEYFGQPFQFAPNEEFLPFDSTGIRYEKRFFYYSKTNIGSKIEPSQWMKISLFPNPNKGIVKHNAAVPIRFLFYSLNGRKIEDVIIEPNAEYTLKDSSLKLYLVEVINQKGERQFLEKLTIE